MPDSVLPLVDVGALVKITVQAGQLVMKYYQSAALNIFRKSDRSPVTDADRAAHRFIEEQLARMTPDFPVLSEEGNVVPYEVRRHWETFWLVDPLDGTREFIEQTGHFAVCIGLIHRRYPLLGVVYMPAAGELFFANGKHAFKTRSNGAVTQLSLPQEPPKVPWRAVCSKGKMPERDRIFLEQLGIRHAEPVGSALKYCALAEGTADLFFRTRGNSEWDSAAGQAILEQAGGHVLDLQGQRFAYNKESLTNPPFVCLGFSNKELIMNALQAVSR